MTPTQDNSLPPTDQDAVAAQDPIARSPWARLLDALALTLLVVAAVHEALIWLGSPGWLPRLPQSGGSDSGVLVGIVFALAAIYGIYLVVRSWRRVG
ncbi:hypothetical protein [Cupriavidus sp. AU9028]|uniref:hypothetical protein n=1 Tax=Cupriavidus sp. AU9028 TaxID=2871157 RepID=UPI001C97D8B4|nr:hypothetical protein [Cupriavidus sp. AU9028]MBY4896074.1 hypothetical protein [Cupriavidus sp. AU9028]